MTVFLFSDPSVIIGTAGELDKPDDPLLGGSVEVLTTGATAATTAGAAVTAVTGAAAVTTGTVGVVAKGTVGVVKGEVIKGALIIPLKALYFLPFCVCETE